MREAVSRECGICGRTFRTRDPKRGVCFVCVPPADRLERQALEMLKRRG
ncbi:MAG: hypothetical protein QW835_02665 [Candidatus Hadarchaeum sp.]